MTKLTQDLREEGAALYAFLKEKPAELWSAETLFKDWTVWDVIAHLHFSDHMAMTTARSDEDFAKLATDLIGYFQTGKGLQGYARDWLGEVGGADLLVRWKTGFEEMCDLFDGYPADARLKWFGPDMGIRMFAAARQMETWAHGQEIYDLLSVDRANTDRIKNVVVIGVKTFAFAYKNRGLSVPETEPFIRLTSPSGEIWDFGDESAENRVTGSAVEFAQVVTQTRNVADTQLVLQGAVSKDWMKIVQCFAGAPEDPPAPGTRHKSQTSIL